MSDGRGREAGFVRKAGGRWAGRAAAALLAAAPLAAAAQEEAREEKAELVFTTDLAQAHGLPEARARALEYVRVVGDLERDQDGNGNTAMHYAAPVMAEILEAIVVRGGRCDARNVHGATPLHFAAAQQGIVGAVGDYSGARAVHILVECGAPPDAQDDRVNAQDDRGMTPLHAVYASVEVTGGLFSPIHFLPASHIASDPMDSMLSGGHREDVLRALLEAGADPNVVDKRGETPLLMLVSSKNTAKLPGIGESHGRSHLRLLFAHGADPDLGDEKGRTPLIRAILAHADGDNAAAVGIVNALLKAGADPDKRDKRGDTPLLHAANIPNNPEVIGALLAGGADPCIADRAGRLPWDHTEEDSAERALLEEAGGARKPGSFIMTNFDGSTYDAMEGFKGCEPGAAEAEAAEGALALDGAARKRIQACLAEAGFDAGAADGLFGPRTRAAIRAWQESRGGGAATGFLTKAGLDALLAACEPGPRPRCAGKAGEEACWKAVEGRPGCYLWDPHPQPEQTVAWSGACEGGKASGKGEEAWRFRGEDGAWETASGEGERRGDKRHGHWVWRYSDGDGREGPYVDGKRHGHWVERYADEGTTWEGPYVDDEAHGLWVERGSLRRGYNCWSRGERMRESFCVEPAEGAMRAVRAVEARSGPGEEYERSTRLGADEKVRVTGAAGAWRRVETADADSAFLGFVLASALEEGPQWGAGAVFRECPECPEMVVVPAGEFMMGSPPSEEGRVDNEGPVHRVTIAEPFAVGVYEVTFEEWDACVSGGGCGGYRPDDEGWGRGGRPVIRVSWDDAQAYVAWLSGKTGEAYRLLSEAEWEYAARAGTTTRYHWGDDVGRNRANCYGDQCGDSWEYTAPVGSFGANGFGLHDMHGNVWEWVEDCRNDGYAGAPSDGSAWESGDCSLRGLRGGSWDFDPRFLRAADRGWYVTEGRSGDSGFRVSRTLAR